MLRTPFKVYEILLHLLHEIMRAFCQFLRLLNCWTFESIGHSLFCVVLMLWLFGSSSLGHV